MTASYLFLWPRALASSATIVLARAVNPPRVEDQGRDAKKIGLRSTMRGLVFNGKEYSVFMPHTSLVMTCATPTMSDVTKIAVVICTYNNASLLADTLAALEKQRINGATKWSALVIDNNSTDETPSVVQQYVHRGRVPGLRYVREEQQGLSFARRRAVRETVSELIAFVDDDCRLAPDWVEKAVAFCDAHPQAGAVGGRVRLQWAVPPPRELLQYSGRLAERDHGDTPQQVSRLAFLVGAGLVVRRAAVVATGWLDQMILVDRQGSSLSSGGDCEIVYRVCNAGYEAWYNPAMALDHYIPRPRMAVPYLCRLHRGQEQCEPILDALLAKQKPSCVRRLRRLCRSVMGLVRRSIGVAIRYLLLAQPMKLEDRIAWYAAIGRLEGAWYALPGRFDV